MVTRGRDQQGESRSGAPGKIHARLFKETIFPRLGVRRPEVVVGPRHGLDAAVVDLGRDRVMVVTTDPFYVLPDFGWSRAAWFAVHILASDAATSGLPAQFLTVDLNLPLGFPDEDLHHLWDAVHMACEALGLAIIAGHTGRYEGCSLPILGGATAIALGNRGKVLLPGLARSGDALVLTKGPAIETVATLAALFPRHLAKELGPSLAQSAAQRFYQMSVVQEAAAAVHAGVGERGVTAMHDATERGVFGAVVELAEASGNGVVLHQDAVPIPEDIAQVCDLFDIDPWTSSSEGTLVLTCRPRQAQPVVAAIQEEGIPAFVVGELLPKAQGMTLVSQGRQTELFPPTADPFWPAVTAAREQGLS